METTRLSGKGQVIIPKSFRSRYKWDAGQELLVIDKGDGILLKSKFAFPKTDLKNVAGCLKYKGKAKSLKDMDDAVKLGAVKMKNDLC